MQNITQLIFVGWDGEIVSGWTNRNPRNLQVKYFVPQT